MKLDNLHLRILLTIFSPFVYPTVIANWDSKESMPYIKFIRLIWTRSLK